MATKEINSFKDLKEFKTFLLSKSKFDIEDISKLIKLYIETVGFYHFKLELKGKESDPDINIKLKGIYELDSSIKSIINSKK